MRWCKKNGCSEHAVGTYAFNYEARQVWITDLVEDPNPACYDLCDDHAERFVAPVGWTLYDLRSEPDVRREDDPQRAEPPAQASSAPELEADVRGSWSPEAHTAAARALY